MSWRSLGAFALACVTSLVAASAFADELNMPVGVTENSKITYDLHMLIFWVCVAIGVVVFGVMFCSILVHRKSLGHEAATFHESTTLEIAWTIVPFVILILMAYPATQTLIAMYDTGGEDMLVEVRGYQWKWEYKYLDQNKDTTLKFFSNLSTPQDEIHNRTAKGENYLLEVDNPLVIPTGKKVRFLVTSNDVIHAWWVPDFAIKRDAIPGILNDIWTNVPVGKEGVYRGQCTELCGKDHGFMPVVVQAVSQQEFDGWYSQKASEYREIQQCVNQEWTADSLYAKGEQVYGQFCVSCHQANGQGLPPAFPALKGGAITTGPKEDHLNLVINGKAGTAMQAFGQQLDPCSLAAVVHFERHSWGNNTDDVTMPQDVLAALGK